MLVFRLIVGPLGNNVFFLGSPRNKQPLQHGLHGAQVSVHHSASLWPFPCFQHGSCGRSVPHRALTASAAGSSQESARMKPCGDRCPPHPPHRVPTLLKSEVRSQNRAEVIIIS